jgi:hypothetical protein
MQVVTGAAFRIPVIADGAQHFAFDDSAAAEHAGGVQHLRAHVQIAEANVLAGLVDDEVECTVARIAHQDAITDGDHVFLIGLAAAGIRIALQA